jgi:hypothetical protein
MKDYGDDLAAGADFFEKFAPVVEVPLAWDILFLHC